MLAPVDSLTLDASRAGFAGVRAALAPPARRPLPAWAALGCAVLMAAAALAACALVILGGWEPARPEGGAVRATLSAR